MKFKIIDYNPCWHTHTGGSRAFTPSVLYAIAYLQQRRATAGRAVRNSITCVYLIRLFVAVWLYRYMSSNCHDAGDRFTHTHV